jgi:hypothetical protein
VREDYHSQWARDTWKESVQIHHSYSKISSKFPRFCQDSSLDYDPTPCKASKSGKKLVLIKLQITNPCSAARLGSAHGHGCSAGQRRTAVARGRGAPGLRQSGLGGAPGPGAGGASVAAASTVNDTATQSGVGGTPARPRRAAPLRAATAVLRCSGRQAVGVSHQGVGPWAGGRLGGGAVVGGCCRRRAAGAGSGWGGCGSSAAVGLG